MESRRLDFLDGLRGYAALGVIVYHLSLITVPQLPLPEWLRPAVLFGGGGVLLFFVVSAFSLCLTMPNHERTGAVLLSFYTKRFFRIAPLFYVVIAYSVLNGVRYGAPWPTPGLFALNLFFVFNLVPGAADSLVFAGWTIGVEMLFYLIFPFLYVRLHSLSRKLAAVMLTIAAYPIFMSLLESAYMKQSVRDRYSLLTLVLYLPAFAIGMLAFHVYRKFCRHERAGESGIVLICAGLCFAVFLAAGRLGSVGLFQAQWVALCFGLLVLGISLTGLPSLLSGPARLFGKISYSTYLLHGPLIILANPIYARIGRLPLPPLVCFAVATIVTLAMLVPLAWLTFYLIETPGMHCGRAVVRRYLAWREARRHPPYEAGLFRTADPVRLRDGTEPVAPR